VSAATAQVTLDRGAIAARRGMAWRGPAGRGRAWHGKGHGAGDTASWRRARRGMARRGRAWHGKARQGEELAVTWVILRHGANL
jgi:hypothetical protein